MAKKNTELAIQKRIRKFLNENNGYRKSDEELISLYAETLFFYYRMRDELLEGDLLIEHTNKFGATNKSKNPLAIELTKTVQALNNLLKSLGLTPAQRKDVGLGGVGGDAFDNF